MILQYLSFSNQIYSGVPDCSVVSFLFSFTNKNLDVVQVSEISCPFVLGLFLDIIKEPICSEEIIGTMILCSNNMRA